MDTEYKLVNLTELVAESISNFRYIDGFANIQIKQKITEEVACWSDALRLTFIFDNLISNAIKFYNHASQTPPYLEIEATASEKKIYIQVKDNGIGIEPEYIGKVFDMFFKTSEFGAGLGLYIVKETVDRLKGSIALHSEPGNGTQVTIEIPNHVG